MPKLTSMWLVFLCISLAHSWAQAPPRRAAPRRPAGAPKSEYKAIFEPVNYGHDINLTDVFFTSTDEGWVSGEHATILHTTNGGTSWTAQVGGDAANSEHPIHSLRFLDSKHGWAIQDDPVRLLRTLDGQNWEKVRGSFPPGVYAIDYTFTSVRHGILLGSNNGGFYVTNDGGRHWQQISPCQLTASVQGLTRTEDCHVRKLQMLSAREGYALVDWSQGFALMRTDDAGQNWHSIVPDVSDCCGPDAFFTDLNHGVLLFNNGRTYVTENGGRNWRALLSGNVGLTSGGATPSLRFSDPEVGWVLGASPDNSDTQRISFSIDGGQHWKMSRNIAFPTGRSELKFNFPRRDRAYIVGPQGMIYRYRIVPGNCTAANILEGPAMPGFGTTEFSAKAEAVRRDIELLRAKLPAPPAQAGMAPGSAGVSSHGGFTQQVDSGFISAASGFTQDTGAPTAGPASADAIAGFVQDSAPVSPALADCCSAALQSLQTDTSAFAQQAPALGSQFKSLNLIVAGTQWVINLNDQAHSVWSSFLALKHASNPQAASVALQQLSTGVNTTQQTGSTGLQDQGGWFAKNAPADFTQDVSPGSSAVPRPSVGTNPSPVIDAVRRKVKNKLPL